MKNKNELRDELEELSPFLAKQWEQGEGFKVPKDYFRSLPEEVLKKVREEQPTVAEPQRNWLDDLAMFFQSLLQPRYAVAIASVAVLVIAGVLLFDGTDQVGVDVPQIASVEEIPDEALENYLTENIDDFSTDLLEEHFAEGNMGHLPGLELEDMEQYLDDALDDMDLDDLEELF